MNSNPNQDIVRLGSKDNLVIARSQARIWLVLIFIVFLNLILNASSPITTHTVPFQITIHDAQKSEIQNGDIIFRKATGLGSQYIISVDTNSDYSHSGIISKVGNKITVIQSSPDQSILAAGVHEESLEKFLQDIPLAAIYRLRLDPKGSADEAVRIAKTFIGTPFDAKLDMSNSLALYCTELVWLSYKNAGIDLVNNHFEKLNLPILGDGFYILPSSLVNSPWLYKVMILKGE